MAVVLNYRTPAQTVACVEALQAHDQAPAAVIVVDNGGADAAALRARLPGVQVLATARNLGFAGGCNHGARVALAAGAAQVLFLNSDAQLEPGALGRLSRALDLPGVGITAPLVLDGAGRVEAAGIRWHPWTGKFFLIGAGGEPWGGEPSVVAAAPGCALLVDREVFEAVGELPTETFFGYEDLEFCLRAADEGFETRCVPLARAVHQGGGTLAPASPERLYYAARNHLRLGRVRPGGWVGRQATILGINLAHALRQGQVPRLAGLRAVLRGARDHRRRRYGQA